MTYKILVDEYASHDDVSGTLQQIIQDLADRGHKAEIVLVPPTEHIVLLTGERIHQLDKPQHIYSGWPSFLARFS